MEKIAKRVVLNGVEIMSLDSTSAQPTDVVEGRTYYNTKGYLTEGTEDVDSSVLGTLNVDRNGAYTPEEGKVGWNYVNVNVKPALQEKSYTPTKEAQRVRADSGYDGLSSVVVNPIPSEYIIPQGTLTITGNGTVNVARFQEAFVAVEGSGSGNTTIIADGPTILILDAEIKNKTDDTITLRR